MVYNYITVEEMSSKEIQNAFKQILALILALGTHGHIMYTLQFLLIPTSLLLFWNLLFYVFFSVTNLLSSSSYMHGHVPWTSRKLYEWRVCIFLLLFDLIIPSLKWYIDVLPYMIGRMVGMKFEMVQWVAVVTVINVVVTMKAI